MILTQVSTAPGGTSSALARQDVTAAVGEPPLRVFRRTLWMRIPTGGLAERLEVAPGAALRATFAGLDYNALTTPITALRGTASALAGGVLVTLDAPRQVVRVILPLSRGPMGSRLEFYRLDGNTPAEEPTLTVAREELMIVEEASPGIVRISRGARAGGGGGNQLIEDRQDHIAVSSSSRYNVDFTDGRFLLRLTNSSGTALPLAPGDLQSVVVRSYPTNPRIGIAVPENATTPADPSAPISLWRADGEVGNGTPASAGSVDAGAALETELGRMLGRFADSVADAAEAGVVPTLPANVDVALVIESDAPCILVPSTSGTVLRAEVLRVRESFPGGAPKQVLRFGPGEAGERTLPLLVPAATPLAELVVRLDLSLSGDRSAGAGAGGGDDPDARSGIHCSPARTVAQRIQLAEATSVTAIALPLMPLSAAVEASLELRADVADSPTGQVLARGSLPPGRPGRFGWSLIALAAPVIISTAPHWLVVTTASGAFVWRTSAADGGLRVLDAAGTSLPAQGLESTTALYDLRTHSGPAADAPPQLLAELAGEPVPITFDGGGRAVVDAGEAASGAAASGAAGTLVELPLRLSALQRGVVTAYPPRIVYG